MNCPSRVGLTYAEIAAHFNINAGRVSEIVNGLRTVDKPDLPGDGMNRA